MTHLKENVVYKHHLLLFCDFSLLIEYMKRLGWLYFRLATPALLQPYCWLLKYYKENKDTTNHAIIKMLHRVVVDLKTPAMLFQLSLFCTFQKILFDPAANQYKVSSIFPPTW